MTLRELIDLATKGEIHELELLSIEGGFYLARAHCMDKAFTLLNEHGKAVHVRSATHLRELLQDLPPSAPMLPCVLVQHEVHDEMCGSRAGPIEPLRMPFSLASGW